MRAPRSTMSRAPSSPMTSVPFVTNTGYDKAKGNAVITSGVADFVAFGVPYIANPDLVERFLVDVPTNKPNPALFYGVGAEGYIDYPTLGDAQAEPKELAPAGTASHGAEDGRIRQPLRGGGRRPPPLLAGRRPQPRSSRQPRRARSPVCCGRHGARRERRPCRGGRGRLSRPWAKTAPRVRAPCHAPTSARRASGSWRSCRASRRTAGAMPTERMSFFGRAVSSITRTPSRPPTSRSTSTRSSASSGAASQTPAETKWCRPSWLGRPRRWTIG